MNRFLFLCAFLALPLSSVSAQSFFRPLRENAETIRQIRSLTEEKKAEIQNDVERQYKAQERIVMVLENMISRHESLLAHITDSAYLTEDEESMAVEALTKNIVWAGETKERIEQGAPEDVWEEIKVIHNYIKEHKIVFFDLSSLRLKYRMEKMLIRAENLIVKLEEKQVTLAEKEFDVEALTEATNEFKTAFEKAKEETDDVYLLLETVKESSQPYELLGDARKKLEEIRMDLKDELKLLKETLRLLRTS